MFGKWFSKKEEKARGLEHPRDLQVGDMLQMLDSFALPPELKGQTLSVVAVNSYQYDHGDDYEFVLKGSSKHAIFLTVEEEDGETSVNFSLKIQRADVDALFGLDQFANIFNDDELATIERHNAVEAFDRWLADTYTQTEDPYIGYFYNSDYRGQRISQYDDDNNGEMLTYYALEDPKGAYGIDIEVWEGGETDVALSIYRPLSDIEALFPGQT